MQLWESGKIFFIEKQILTYRLKHVFDRKRPLTAEKVTTGGHLDTSLIACFVWVSFWIQIFRVPANDCINFSKLMLISIVGMRIRSESYRFFVAVGVRKYWKFSCSFHIYWVLSIPLRFLQRYFVFYNRHCKLYREFVKVYNFLYEYVLFFAESKILNALLK